ncbi:MAG: porin [Mediterranea massiliensis]|nr:porin [Mediterranea massiliensis]
MFKMSKRLGIKLAGFLWALSMMYPVYAQEGGNSLSLQAEARVDYQAEYIDGNKIKPNTGFKGKYLNVILNGTIGHSFSYAYRQRLNKAHADQSFFDATDWLYLTYHAGTRWELSAGKQVVNIGGYEYDRAPIDLYFCSEYWNNIPCYQFGVSAAYVANDGKDKFIAQLCESPFQANADDMYAYNLMWYGSHGSLSTIYSLNLIEYLPGKYISYIALGNQFQWGRFRLQFDFMNRATDQHTFFFKDCSVMSELQWNANDYLDIFAKVTYDVNKSHAVGDYCVMPGTELTRIGGGLEFYPLTKKNRNIRLHANYSYTTGRNGNEAGALIDKQSFVDVGLKWKIDILSYANKILK